MFVTYQDVINRWNGHGDSQAYPISQTVTETFIEDAEALILKEFATLQQRVDEGSLNPTLIKQVVSRMINSYITNGNGLSQHIKTVGPYTDNKSYSTKTTRSYLELTSQDIETLSPPDTSSDIGQIFTIEGYGNVGLYDGHLSAADYQAGWRHWGRFPS